jgi:endo-1,4-beta-xylanase
MVKYKNSFRLCTLCKFLKKMASVIAILSLLLIGHTTDLRAQLASCHSKFVGNIWYNGTMPLHYDQYFNQLTPENATKWSSVQGSGSNSWNWGDATSMYNYCKSHGDPFKFHTLVWGNQYPTWLDNTSNKAAAVENWIREAGRTFPNCDFVDVVNECLPNHAQPSWLGSIGGANGLYGTGWDWVVWSFEKALRLRRAFSMT